MHLRKLLFALTVSTVLCSPALAQVSYTITGTLTGASGPDPLGLNNTSATLTGTLDQGMTPANSTTGPGSTSNTYNHISNAIQLSSSKLGGPYSCSDYSSMQLLSVTLTDIVGPNSDQMSIANCKLITTVWYATISIPPYNMVTAVPASIPSVSVSGTVTYVTASGSTQFTLTNGSLVATGTAPPAVTPNPSSWSPSALQGSTTPLTQGIMLSASAPVSYTTSASGSGVSISLQYGNTTSADGTTNAGKLYITANPTGLAAGTYNGNVTVNYGGNAGSQQIPVTFTITPKTLTASPTSMTFNYTIGGTAPASQGLSINTNPSSATTVNAAVTSGNSWLQVSPASGSTPNASFTVSVSTSGLSAGTLNGNIQITASGVANSPLNIPVTYNVAAQPTLTVPSNPLNFTYTIGQSAPQAQQVSIGGTNGLAFTASNGGASWFSVSPASGTVPGNVSVSINTNGLTVGTYNGTLTVTAAGASGSPATVPVNLTVTAPAISAAPSSLTFNYQIGGTAVPPQSINVSGTSGIAFSVGTSGGSWLSATPTSGTVAQSVSVNVNPSGLAAGTYNGTVTVTSNGATGSPATVGVTLNVTAPTLTATPSSLNFTYQVGSGNPQPQTVNIGGTAGQNFTAAASGGSWLSVQPTSGSTPGSVSVSVNPAGLATNTYNGTVTISAPGAAPQTVTATLLVTAAPTISPSPTSMSFSYQPGGSLPAAQTLNVGGTSGLAYTLAASGGAWLAVNPASGTTPGTASVTVNPTGLAAGTYNGTITVTASGASNSPATVGVTLTVRAAPSLNVSPAHLSFSYTLGGTAPAAQSLSIASSGAAISYTVATAGGGWLSVSPNSGTTPGSVSVSADVSSLTAGTYNGTITITSAGASNSPQTVPVQLTVANAPTITVTPNQLSFAFQIGGMVPAAQSVSVGGATGLSASVNVSGGNWLTATPPSGAIPFNLSVSVNPSGLAAGTYNGAVTLMANGASNSPQTIPVKLVVSTSSTITASPSSLTFTAQAGGSAPAPQTVNLTGTSALAFTTAVSSGSGWLSVTGGSGVTPAPITVSVNPAGLNAGTYTGAVTITAAGVGNSPLAIPVTFTVAPPPGPVITAITSAASYLSTGFSPGDIVAIFGTNLGPATPVQFSVNAAGKLDNTLAGVQVAIDGAPAIPLFVSDKQINVILPFTTNTSGEGSVIVTYNNTPSTAFKVPLAPADLALFTADASGSGPGAILNQDYTYNGPNNPAPKGSVVALFGTGGGVMDPPVNAGDIAGSTLSNIPSNVTATVNGEPATVAYAGSAPGLVYGVNQFNVQIPADAQSGQAVILLQAGHDTSQQKVTVFVQ